MKKTLENWKIQEALCLITQHNLHDKILTKREQKILARYYLSEMTPTEIAKRYKGKPEEIWGEIQRARQKILKIQWRLSTGSLTIRRKNSILKTER